jgi:Flp pilus assembly protein TadG
MKFSSGNRRRRGERGSVLVVSAVGMLGFLLATGLCVDISHFYLVKTELQNAADAAALAGASALDSSSKGITTATDRAVQAMNSYEFNKTGVAIPRANVRFAKNLTDFDNGKDVSEASASAQGMANKIRFVRVQVPPAPVKVFFASMMLGGTRNVSADAVAGMSVPINKVCEWIPLSVVDDDVDTIKPGNLYIIRAGPGGNGNRPSPGNYQALSFGGHGSNILRDNLASGVHQCITAGDTVETEPGVNAGPVRQGINTRFDDYNGGNLDPATEPPDTNVAENITHTQYENGAPIQAPSHTPVAGRRLVIIPIIKKSEFDNGRDVVRIDRFGIFFLQKSVDGGNGGDITAEFVGDTITIGGGGFDPNGGTPTSVLAIPVLYR